ncbi:D-alanine--D-alanyl carrier protein ligase [Seminavis robusta]|uniref:D-alanine--D-alanyl carrier protein ligase n=1 Tax=Seminavis robusta TaxID=568900 RepID=A0A9N8ERN9_9STRA|nr:D-alanine--D-alanyl carrier protein ligase [Seminavis robusta]|eukprot:Sro1753_g295420.1 D-alanine--D-alanyl carrier protein ligase (1708) ;mRNA; f:8876-14149
MKSFSTILEALYHHAAETPDKIVFTWVNIKCEEQNKMTFKELEDQSNAVAARLIKLGCKKGDRVMVAYPFGLEFLTGMFGAMKIGVIPCSIYPPNPNQLKIDMPKFRRFAEDAGAKFAISTSMFATAMTATGVLYKTGVKWIGTDKLSIKKSNPTKKPRIYEKFVGEPEDICFIQYTSGSTGRPKGVMITHNNLVETCKAGVALTDCLEPNDVEVLWVPQYHDMGLVTGFMGATYSGTPLVMASPLDFIVNPLLWTDMVETYQATLTCAPNFAYALLLKRLKQANRTANWSCVKRAMFGGEPAQSHVVEAVAKTLSVKPEHIYNNYGLAESVVLLTGGPACPDAEGVVCCGVVDSPTLKLRIVEDGKEVEQGKVGSIWAQSPRVAAGYYGQPELTTSIFANALLGYDGIWLDTGDLGKVVDGQLYVTGRVKDVIIINGKNYYPTDVELSVDETFGDIIRPGRTSAFQHGEASVGITVEGRTGFDKSVNERLAVQIANHASQVHGLFVSEVLVLKLGVTPKTTSGKLKRSEIRKTTLAGDWKASDVLIRFQQHDKPVPLIDDSTYICDFDPSQTNALPGRAVKAVRAIECDPSKLDDNFFDLHLSGVPGIEGAWSKAVKTTTEMQTMCSQIMQHLVNKHPTICQLAHTLCENPGWILIDDRTGFLSQLAHQVFVLQWVSTFMMDHPGCMQQKLQNDKEEEALNPSIQGVPSELQEFLNLPEQDPMYGNWPFFFWIKNRSTRVMLELALESVGSPEGPAIETQIERINNLGCINLLEAVWLEQNNDLKENSEVGRILATHPVLAARIQSKMALMEHSNAHLNDLYIAWNMHVVSWIGDDESSSWLISKLLLPCIVGDAHDAFMYARLTSLYLVLQTIGRKLKSPKFSAKSILSRRALHSFGRLNLSWAQKLGCTTPSQTSNNGMALNEAYWLSNFNQWGGGKDRLAQTSSTDNVTNPEDCFSTRYANTITSVLGSEVDASKTWAENGLTSLKSAELRNKVEEELHVVLPANFEQLYTTSTELAAFLEASESKSFAKQDWYNNPDFLKNSSGFRLNKLQLAVVQTVGLLAILLLFFVSVVPSYFLVTWVLGNCDSNEEEVCHGPFFWALLPLAFPLFLLSLSVIVVLCKVAVVRNYRSQQYQLLSWDYVRWWFVDRILDIWESIVGQFLLETKFIWIFYKILGADLAWSAKIESYIREFDLVTVGKNSVISHPMKCRKFSHSNGDGNPKITFYPIVVGKNCKISGMVSPGTMIGDGSKVEKLSVVDEGAIVPDGVLAQGNPAYNAGLFEHQESLHLEESMFDIFKIFWMVFEAYHFFALSFLVHVALNSILPDWRYATILHWILLVPVSSLLALLTSIALKWVLIGKRDPLDVYEGSLYHRATNWACDFHFRVASWTLTPFFGQSRGWNFILFLHGLDVDMESILNNPYIIFFPSKVDFVKIEKSFVGTITLDMTTPADSKIQLINSSIGYGVNVHAGVKVIRSKIPPRSNVSDSVYDLNHSSKTWKPSSSALLLPEVAQLLLNAVIFVSLIPSFEIGSAALKSSSTAIAMFGLTGAVALQLVVWILLTRAVEGLMLHLPHSAQQDVFGIYINNVWIFGVGNWLVILLYGTPMFAHYARFMGAEVDGDLWYFGNALYEYGKLHFQGCTIVDSAHVSGHYIDGNGLAIADTYVSGLLHPGCYASAGSAVTGKENGPWKVFLRSDPGMQGAQ